MISCDPRELNTTQRVALVVNELKEERKITSARVRELTGLKHSRARGLLAELSLILPIYLDEETFTWHFCNE